MTITEILDAVAPGDDVQALTLMLIVGACEQASSLMLDDVPRLVTALTEEASKINITCGGFVD